MKAALSKVLKPSGKAAKLRAIVKAGGFSFSFVAPSAGKLSIVWVAKVKGKKTTITIVFRQAGKATVKIKLTGPGRKLLKAAKTVKITNTAAFTPAGGVSITSSKTITLR